MGLIANIAARMSAWIGIFMASLHESRQQQALYTIERYRYLVNDDSDKASKSRMR